MEFDDRSVDSNGNEKVEEIDEDVVKSKLRKTKKSTKMI